MSIIIYALALHYTHTSSIVVRSITNISDLLSSLVTARLIKSRYCDTRINFALAVLMSQFFAALLTTPMTVLR